MSTAENTEGVISGRPEGRRRRSKLERRQVVEETLQAGASVAVVARAHGINANQVFHWRELYREGLLEAEAEPPASITLLPVRIGEVMGEQQQPAKLYSGTIEIELGRARIRVEGSVDPESLRIIFEQIGR